MTRGVFHHAGDGHVEIEFGLDLVRFVDRAADGRGRLRVRRGGEGDVAFAGEQAGSGIQPDPARAGQINFGPGVEIGEVGFGAGRAAIDRFDIGGELDEITGDEARGEAELAADLNEKPRGVATGTALEAERFLDGLDARFHADDVGDFVVDEAVEIDEEVDG